MKADVPANVPSLRAGYLFPGVTSISQREGTSYPTHSLNLLNSIGLSYQTAYFFSFKEVKAKSFTFSNMSSYYVNCFLLIHYFNRKNAFGLFFRLQDFCKQNQTVLA